jgi:hypothetical protein
VTDNLGEPNLKRALQWVLERLAEDPRAKRSALIDEVSRRFDLTPLETDFLYAKLVEAAREGGPQAGGR